MNRRHLLAVARTTAAALLATMHLAAAA